MVNHSVHPLFQVVSIVRQVAKNDVDGFLLGAAIGISLMLHMLGLIDLYSIAAVGQVLDVLFFG